MTGSSGRASMRAARQGAPRPRAGPSPPESHAAQIPIFFQLVVRTRAIIERRSSCPNPPRRGSRRVRRWSSSENKPRNCCGPVAMATPPRRNAFAAIGRRRPIRRSRTRSSRWRVNTGSRAGPNSCTTLNAANPADLDRFDRIARDLIAAYAGDADALARLNERLSGTKNLRAATAGWSRSDGRKRRKRQTRADFTLSDARLFVARALGFESWDSLIASVTTPATDPRSAPSRPEHSSAVSTRLTGTRNGSSRASP